MAITYALLVNAGFVFTLQQNTSGNVAVGGPAAPLVSKQSGALPFLGSTTPPSAQTMAHWQSVARCMRRHGVSRVPQPQGLAPDQGCDLGSVQGGSPR